MKRETDTQFLERIHVIPDPPSTWEQWESDGRTLRGDLAEYARLLFAESEAHAKTHQNLNMWRMAAITAGVVIVMLIFAGWGK